MRPEVPPSSSVRRWQRLEALFHDAAELTGTRRERFLADVDEELRPELLRLLAAEDEAGEFMEEGPVGQMPMTMPERLGPYRLVEPIGEGGAGTVYLARRDDEAFAQEVAIKILRRERVDADLLRRFQSERQILAGLDHANIAKILDGGRTEDGLPYFVMELVKGEPLDAYCRARHLDVKERLELFRKVCGAVHHAHQRLIVHRDLKPGNILVTADGEPKLLDFGIAKLLDPDQLPVLQATTRWYRPMTPRYASPEQIQGKTVTTRSDVYSLGVILYELLTDRPAYRVDGHRLQDLERAVMSAQVLAPSLAVLQTEDRSSESTSPEAPSPKAPSLKALSRRLAGDLDTIALKALRKEPSRRYGSVVQLSSDVRRHLQGMPVQARPDTWRYRAGKLVRRRPWESAAALLFVVMSLTLVTFLALQTQRLATERDEAQRQRDSKSRLLDFMQSIFYGVDPVVSGETRLTAMELIDRGAGRLEEFDDDPETQAALQFALGKIYFENAQISLAEPLFQSAVDTLRAEQDADEENLIEALKFLGITFRRQMRYDEAEVVQLEVLNRRRDLHGAGSLEELNSMIDLAVIYSWTQRQEKALETYQKALDGYRAADAMETVDATTILNNMGTTLLRLDRLEEAERAYAESLRLRIEVLGPNEHYTLSTRANLANVLVKQRRLREAGEHLDVLCPEKIRIFGEDHEEAQFCRLLQIKTARLEGRWDEARELLERLEGYWPIGEGELVAWTAVAMERSRFSLDALELDRAEKAVRAVLEALSTRVSDTHPMRLLAAAQLVAVLAAKGEPSQEAFDLQTEILKAKGPQHGWGHFRLAYDLSRLALLQARLGATEKHLHVSDDALERLDQAPAPPADQVAAMWTERAEILELLSRSDEAATAREQAYSIFSAVFGKKHPIAKRLKSAS